MRGARPVQAWAHMTKPPPEIRIGGRLRQGMSLRRRSHWSPSQESSLGQRTAAGTLLAADQGAVLPVPATANNRGLTGAQVRTAHRWCVNPADPACGISMHEDIPVDSEAFCMRGYRPGWSIFSCGQVAAIHAAWPVTFVLGLVLAVAA